MLTAAGWAEPTPARAVAPVVRLERGPWSADVSGVCDQDGCLGLLVLA